MCLNNIFSEMNMSKRLLAKNQKKIAAYTFRLRFDTFK